MADRDIPSVPITTLAGLANLSDLLSELPICESSVITSLHKSLLFHPRVAEEANNLLSIKDDALTRQLVHAIEQTNADHIELKSQYAEQPTSGTNINELPQLLQAIHTLKPTVFKTGSQQRQHIIAQPKSSPHPHATTNANQSSSITTVTTTEQQNLQTTSPISSAGNQTNAWTPQPAQQPPPPLSQPVVASASPQSSQHGAFNYATNHSPASTQSQISSPNMSSSPSSSSRSRQSSTLGHNKMPLPIVMSNQPVVIKTEPPSVAEFNSSDLFSALVRDMPMADESLSHIPPQSHQNVVNQNATTNRPPPTVPPIGQQNSSHSPARQQPPPSSVGQTQKTVIRENNTTVGQKTTPRNNEYLQKQSKSLDARGGPSPAQASDAPSDSHPASNPNHQTSIRLSVDSASTTPSKPPKTGSDFATVMKRLSASYAAAKSSPVIRPTTGPDSGRSSNKISPASSECSISSMTNNQPKVSLSRLKIEHVQSMETSLTDFAKQAPFIARKLGVLQKREDAEIRESPKDMFTMMKDDEQKGTKRTNTTDIKEEDEITHFSQPKMRRIQLKPLHSTKSTKEDVTKSQTYQQFMKNMEHELQRLEEVEQPNNDDMDYHSDCISSKMLGQLTNDVAKLKAKGAIDVISRSKLTLLINFAMRNVDVCRNLSAGPDMDEDNTDDYVEKILDAAEACLLVSTIYSTANKDIKFLQEDNMDRIVKFVQFQMRETIFPSFDPVFTTLKTNTSKKSDKQKKKAAGLTRSVQTLYNKLVELTKIFVTLFDNCAFVDTIVLAVSTLAVEPFFVDNIETLQFACLELVTTIFRKENYVKYRSSILNDILTSVDRLPCSKKNLRPYKLANNGGSIQMVTALVLQLIQCSSVLPSSLSDTGGKLKKKAASLETELVIDRDLLILEKYDTAFSIGGNFLTTFLNKCKTRSGETDFRPLFENFIYDLLTTVNKPEWPAAELLLSLLGTLLVKYMSDKSIEQAIRVVSLEYLGIVAARLRKDTVESRCKVNTMDALIKCIKLEQEKDGDNYGYDNKIVVDPEEERTEFLQKILLDFLAVNAQEDNLIWDYARHFYLTQWYKDVIQRKKKIAEGEKGYASRKKNPKKRTPFKEGESDESGSESESEENDSDMEPDKNKRASKNGKKANTNIPDQELNLEIFRMLDARKRYFISKIQPFCSGPTDNSTAAQDIRTYIDYSNAHLIAQYLASRRPFSQSFDKYLQKIILVVREPSIAIRTKAMKCLAMIVEVDASILKRKDMEMGVRQKLLDTSISVREAAVDLVGKYVLSSPDLIDQYYDMLSKRILDTGVSVRKRVIKILRDICIEYPDFDKIPEICVKMIRRVNDEEGIQKLVTEVFMRMWFTPCEDSDVKSIVRKIDQISDVVSMAQDTGTSWLGGLLDGIFTPKEEKDIVDRAANAPKREPPKEVIKACQQLADGLVNAIIQLEGTDHEKVLNCVTTLHLLAKVRPLLLVKHAITLEPYLNIKGNKPDIVRFISCVAEILELVVPLMEHPSENFLADLETHLMMLVCSHNQMVVTSCLGCLGAVVNYITKNYKLIRDCFVKCYKPILISRKELDQNSRTPYEQIFKPMFRRGLFTIGLICRNFDFNSPAVYGDGLGSELSELPAEICKDIFDHLLFFAQLEHNEIRRETLVAIGNFCIKNYDYLTNNRLRSFYCSILTEDTYAVESKINVLRNISNYLQDADQSMTVKEKDWQTQSLVENLCDMGDVISGMASRIIQLYLRAVLASLMHKDYTVRFWSIKLIEAVLRQGLVHPVQIVPYLICLGTDTRQEIGHRADKSLQSIDKQYPGFVNMKCHQGIQLSYELQRTLQMKNEGKTIVRGFVVKEKGEQPTAMNGFLYTLLRSTKPQRRALVQSVTKQFDDQRTTLPQMLYLADNLAYFPYMVQDEPLYIIHQIDLFVSCTGTNLLQTFRESLIPLPGKADQDKLNPLDDEDDDEDLDSIMARIPEDASELQKCMLSAQGCILLLILKQHLKTTYRLTESKISRYSPSEAAKVYEKSMQRHPVDEFQPKSILDIIRQQSDQMVVEPLQLSDDQKSQLVERYLDFKQLMLKIDKEESENDSDRPPTKSVPSTPVKGSEMGESGSTNDPQMPVLPNKENSPANAYPSTPSVPSNNQHHHNRMHTQQPQTTPNSMRRNSHMPPNHTSSSSVATPNHYHSKSTASHAVSNSSRTAHQQRSTKKVNTPSRTKRKKRRIASSSEEDSESDYA